MWLAETEWFNAAKSLCRGEDIKQEIKNDVVDFQFMPSTKVNNYGNQ